MVILQIPARVKQFYPDEMRAMLKPVWEKIERMEEAIPFRVPVDPDLLGIPVSFTTKKNTN